MKENKIIAEFMGGQYVDEHLIEFENFYSIKDIGDEFEYTNCFDSDNELKFHSSWDWLMPVANEIIKSREEQNADWDLTDLKYALCTTNIEWVYKAVINFIKHKHKLEQT